MTRPDPDSDASHSSLRVPRVDNHPRHTRENEYFIFDVAMLTASASCYRGRHQGRLKPPPRGPIQCSWAAARDHAEKVASHSGPWRVGTMPRARWDSIQSYRARFSKRPPGVPADGARCPHAHRWGARAPSRSRERAGWWVEGGDEGTGARVRAPRRGPPPTRGRAAPIAPVSQTSAPCPTRAPSPPGEPQGFHPRGKPRPTDGGAFRRSGSLRRGRSERSTR